MKVTHLVTKPTHEVIQLTIGSADYFIVISAFRSRTDNKLYWRDYICADSLTEIPRSWIPNEVKEFAEERRLIKVNS